MHNDFNQFILSLDFEINEFNVGKNYERAYIILCNYKDWITNNFTNDDRIISKIQFEKIIDELMFNDLNSQKRQEYNSLKQLPLEEYSLDLISIYKLYLILKVRTRQIASNDLEIVETQKGLEKVFYPLNWSDKEKKEISIERDLPEINKNEKSSQALLPLSLLILTLSLSKIFSTSTFVMIIQLFMFLVIGSMLAKVIKGQKSDKDVDELKAWDYVVNSNFKK